MKNLKSAALIQCMTQVGAALQPHRGGQKYLWGMVYPVFDVDKPVLPDFLQRNYHVHI